MSRRRKGARLEMTSLMDVMFLVLVFFIYCIFDMTVHRGVKVDLPRAAGAEERGERLVVTIRVDDTLQLNGAETTKDEILAKAAALKQTEALPPIIISADRKASLGCGLELLSELKGVGVEKVSFQVAGREQ